MSGYRSLAERAYLVVQLFHSLTILFILCLHTLRQRHDHVAEFRQLDVGCTMINTSAGWHCTTPAWMHARFLSTTGTSAWLWAITSHLRFIFLQCGSIAHLRLPILRISTTALHFLHLPHNDIFGRGSTLHPLPLTSFPCFRGLASSATPMSTVPGGTKRTA